MLIAIEQLPGFLELLIQGVDRPPLLCLSQAEYRSADQFANCLLSLWRAVVPPSGNNASDPLPDSSQRRVVSWSDRISRSLHNARLGSPKTKYVVHVEPAKAPPLGIVDAPSHGVVVNQLVGVTWIEAAKCDLAFRPLPVPASIERVPPCPARGELGRPLHVGFE